MQRYNSIFILIGFFLASPFIFTLTNMDHTNFAQNNTISTKYSLDNISSTVGYNVLTHSEEIEYFTNTRDKDSFQNTIPSYLGDNTNYNNTFENEGLQMSYVFPPDGRVKITDTSSYPWSSICKLEITAADKSLFIGSGAIIDPYHVLTCGHCIYIHDHGGWVSQVRVIPGQAGQARPFGIAFATYYRTYNEWIQSEAPQHDWALITLDRTIGNQTGWMGRKTALYTDPIYIGTLYTAGYPGDLDNGEYMYYDSDVGDRADNFNHWYWMDTAGGQSGSPVWEEVNGSYYILTINAYEYENGTDANFGTRLNQDKFDQLNIWLGEDTPPSNPGGLDFTIIIIIIAVVGLAVIVLSIIIASRRSRSKLEVAKPIDQETTFYSSQSIPLFTPHLYSQNIGVCPNCGKQFFRGTQKFCSNCGYDLNIESEHNGES
ncbi:MAG: trypsin-like peptidase domain-containing protein [Candidatus Lokiarchaeia archaeon]|nr:trypsin-like peptidase domain-containing protein [Candidatus Lokiarchaeia archaeon]